MAKSILSANVLQNETAAYAWVEARVWPNGPVCPHCGGVDRISQDAGQEHPHRQSTSATSAANSSP